MTLLRDVAQVEAVRSRPHSLLEAPRLCADGSAVYSDAIAGGLWECSPQGSVRELLAKRRGIGGAVAHAHGGWVISGRSLLHVLANGDQREIFSSEEVCGFNDLGSTPEGALLAGALRYRPLAGEPEQPGQLLQINPDGSVEVLSTEVVWPNGIGVSPDGQTIYVSDYARGLVLALARDGRETREFCSSPSGSTDGLALDANGGVWVALGEGGGVARFHADGTLDEIAELPAGFVSSLCFGGADMRDVLLSTADNPIDPDLGGTLLTARSVHPGLPVTAVAV